jgi:hypothetical protein
MDADAKLQQYLLLGKSAKGRSMCELITKATAEPSLFTFGELLDLPTVQEVRDEAAARELGDLPASTVLAHSYCCRVCSAATRGVCCFPGAAGAVLLWHISRIPA